MNAFIERWFRSLKSEALDRMIFFGQKSLERALQNYVARYHAKRSHQGLSNKLIEPEEVVVVGAGKIEFCEWLGGMLKYYCRAA